MPQAIRPAFITCARCGTQKQVGQRGSIPTYCSTACRTGKQASPHLDIQCAHCGTPTTGRAGTKYCSPRCRNAASYQARREDGRYETDVAKVREAAAQRRAINVKPCPYCADPMLNPRRVQCGKPECRRTYQRDRVREWQRTYKTDTGSWYHRNYAEEQREYDKRRREDRKHWRQLYPEAAAAGDARRRMLLQQATTGDPFAPIDVYERDQWNCGLCQQPVDPELPWPHPQSASLDHVQPLSLGGEHSLTNVQCAHLACNASKGNRTTQTT